VEQVEAGLQIYVEQVEQEQGGLQIDVEQVEEGQGVCPAEPLHLTQSATTRPWNFRQKLAKPLIVEDHDDARALHCRRRAGPGRQHCLAVRVAALLTHLGLQAVDPAAKAVLGALPSKRRACWRGEVTELWRPSHRSMLRLLMVEAAEQRESHCAAASSLCLDQPAAAVEPDACR